MLTFFMLALISSCSDSTPTLGKLSLLKTAEGKKINIIAMVTPKWQRFGDQLEFDEDGTTLGMIESNHSKAEACCRAMFQHWIKGNGVRPCSWRKLIELLEDCDFGILSEQVRSVFSAS